MRQWMYELLKTDHTTVYPILNHHIIHILGHEVRTKNRNNVSNSDYQLWGFLVYSDFRNSKKYTKTPFQQFSH